MAECILFKGLHFSLLDSVVRDICNEFKFKMADEKLHYFTNILMFLCETTYLLYKLSDNFTDSPKFELHHN
ncbi:DUF1896 family protein [Flavobacterium frigidarium]|uniref:DUF1896 family protein n=1 Tax=Flavobacterium frigidarium TaxID=99286 RepID=UPI00352F381E